MKDGIYELNVDPGMEAFDNTEVDEIEEDEIPKLVCDLVNGVSMSANYPPEALEDMYNNLENLDDTILDTKKMLFDLVRSSDEDRDENIQQLLEVLGKFHSDTGLDDMDYNVRDGITEYEKAILMCVNMIILLTEMKHAAQLYHANNYSMSLGHDLAELFDGLGELVPADELLEDFLDQASDTIVETTEEEKKEETEDAE